MEHFYKEGEAGCRQEARRRLITLASEYGKSLVSQQTGYLHYYGPHASSHDTIPFLDNLHFVLILMRTHLVENIQEGKKLIKSLLAFEKEGCFPRFLHEYPHCADSYLGIKALMPLSLIFREYGHILGEELRDQLQGLCLRILKDEQDLPFLLAIKKSCAMNLLGIKSCLSEPVVDWNAFPIEVCAEAALSGGSVQSISVWRKLYDHLLEKWHPGTLSYAGPPNFFVQRKTLPLITSYELLMWNMQGIVPERKDLMHSHALLWAGFLTDVKPVQFQDASALRLQVQSKKEMFPPHKDHRFHPLYGLWGTGNSPSTFVCQTAPHVLCHAVQDECSAVLAFSFTEPFAANDDAKSMEIAFYLSKTESVFHPFTVNHERANTFQRGDTLCIPIEYGRIECTFDCSEDSVFVGHCFPGNRPSQSADKGEDIFSAFDWQFSLRTLSRSDLACVKVCICFIKAK